MFISFLNNHSYKEDVCVCVRCTHKLWDQIGSQSHFLSHINFSAALAFYHSNH